MENSMFLARLLGPYCLIIGVSVFVNLKTYRKMAEDLAKSPALIYLGGVVALIFGLLIVQVHNLWVGDWRVVITLVGWLGLIKGIWLIGFPNSMTKVLDFYRKNDSVWAFRLGLVMIIGLTLTFFGYFTG